MEPVTHFLTGACIGRAGFNRKTAYATLAAVLAAEAADLDVLWSFAGPVEVLKHHRGITHTFWAVPVVAGVVVGAVWLLDRGLKARRRNADGAPSLSSAAADEKDGAPSALRRRVLRQRSTSHTAPTTTPATTGTAQKVCVIPRWCFRPSTGPAKPQITSTSAASAASTATSVA